MKFTLTFFNCRFEALCLVPFNINSHYVDDQDSDYNGESREERILQFLEHNDYPVLGLREGTALLVDGNTAALIGSVNARLFWKYETKLIYFMSHVTLKSPFNYTETKSQSSMFRART